MLSFPFKVSPIHFLQDFLLYFLQVMALVEMLEILFVSTYVDICLYYFYRK